MPARAPFGPEVVFGSGFGGLVDDHLVDDLAVALLGVALVGVGVAVRPRPT